MLRLGTRPWWIEVLWEPRDCWIGARWRTRAAQYGTALGTVRQELHVYVCVLPCLPIHVVIGQPDREPVL